MNQFQVFGQFSTTELAIPFLQARGIIKKKAPNCCIIGCHRPMTVVKYSSLNDGVIWRCPSHKGQKMSLRNGSFLDGQHLPLNIFLLLAYHWAYATPVGIAQEFAQVSHVTAIQWYSYCRDICSQWLVANPIRLGGPGVVVQIDEKLERKNNIDHVPERRIFGMYDCQRKIGILELVEDRSRNTLLPIIQRHLLPGTEIHSDQWEAYRAIPAIPVIPAYTHVTVNRAQNFVDPVTGAHLNNVECFWKNAKQKMKQTCSTSEHVQFYLDEIMWRQINGKKGLDAFENILQQIAQFYPV